jgi:UPF0755 protein
MPLQIDATVRYALGETTKPRLDQNDLRVRSPYNTYIRKGLPPTPIASPGAAAIEAALHPAAGNWLYYVLTSKDGHHSFTADPKQFAEWKAQAQAAGIF